MGQMMRDVENQDRRLEEIRQRVESTLSSTGMDLHPEMSYRDNQQSMPGIQSDYMYDNPINLERPVLQDDVFPGPNGTHENDLYYERSPIANYEDQLPIDRHTTDDFYDRPDDMYGMQRGMDQDIPAYDDREDYKNTDYYDDRGIMTDEGVIYDDGLSDVRERSPLRAQLQYEDDKHQRRSQRRRDHSRYERDRGRDNRDRGRDGRGHSRDDRGRIRDNRDLSRDNRDGNRTHHKTSGHRSNSREHQSGRQRSLDRSRDNRSDSHKQEQDHNISVEHTKRGSDRHDNRGHRTQDDRVMSNHGERSQDKREEGDDDIVTNIPEGENYMVKAFFCTLCDVVLLEGRQQLDEHCREKSHYIEFQKNKVAADGKSSGKHSTK
ncbi:uncharacterized protein DDB_G0283697-like isoform X2 [Ptychodera flava]